MAAIFFHIHLLKYITLTILITLSINKVIIADKSKLGSTASPAHFVLIHGACHGGWSWYKVRTLLEKSGYKVSSPDLKSAGIDPSDANTIFTFDEYNQPLHDILASLPHGEKVILVGHSAGGVSVTNAIQNFPEKLQVAVYAVGQMQRSESQIKKYGKDVEHKLSNLTEVYDFIYGQGEDNPPTSAVLKKEVLREKLYNMSPLEDYTLATMLLKAFPIRATQNMSNGNEESYEAVPRVYIRTKYDKLFPIVNQDALIQSWPPAQVYTVASDHILMLSNPIDLFAVLVNIATEFSTSTHHHFFVDK